MLTLRDLLRDLDVQIVAGEAGLEAPVRWVHISELLDPTPWLSGGELLLTTGMQLDTAARQREFVERLVQHGLAGLGIGTGFKHDRVPPPLVAAAAARQFPVFEVPYELPFIAITEAAFTQLVNEHYGVMRRAIAAHERLERLVLSEQGLDALARTLSDLIEGDVVVLDARGYALARGTALDQAALADLSASVIERTRAGEGRPFVPESGGEPRRGLALPVTVGEGSGARTAEAWLIALKRDGGLSDFDRLTLHQAVTIVALELLRRRVADDTERRLAGDVLGALAAGGLNGVELARRLSPFGLGERVAAIVLERSSAAIERTLAAALREEASPGLVAASGAITCALVPGLADDELFAFAARIGDRLDGAGTVGVGRAVAAGDARRSFLEARCALQARSVGVGVGEANGNGAAPGALASSSGVAGHDGVATYKDLGSFQLLLSLQDDEALRLFCDSILAPIENCDGHYGDELLRSLEAFVEENGQWERAARRLYCHRHTLRYRIRKIEELTGRDLASARTRIDFWLALRGRELVRR